MYAFRFQSRSVLDSGRVDREIEPEAEKIGSRLAFCTLDENIARLDRPITVFEIESSTVDRLPVVARISAGWPSG